MDDLNNDTVHSSTQKTNYSNKRKPESSAELPSQRRPKRNIMLEEFTYQVLQSSYTPLEYIPKPFFFYGTLADPTKLQELLQLPSPPLLKLATVRSHKIMLWEQYLALVPAPKGTHVGGVAYVPETEEHFQILKHYETDAYNVQCIRIQVNRKEVSGRVLKWGSDDLEELTEGTWSLEEWKRAVEEEMASHFLPVED